MEPPAGLLRLPDEILTAILSRCTTPSLIQMTLTCHKFYDLAADSREVILQNLHRLPGIKLGLDDFTVPTEDLFLLLRQRASKQLCGAYFMVDCTEHKYLNSIIDAKASCMAEVGADYINMSTVLKDSLTLRLYGSKCALKESIESPYADGIGRILQVVHRKHTISILYQWQHESRDGLSMTDEPIVKAGVRETLTRSDSEERLKPKSGTDGQTPIKTPTETSSKTKVYYHLLHYNAYTMDRPYFFIIDQHKNLAPRHLTVNSRLLCAILWDKPGTTMPTYSAEIVLYSAARCPVNEAGVYETAVVWSPTLIPRPPAPTPEMIISGRVPRLPTQISFFKDGRRLKSWAPGEVVPHSVIGTGSSYDSRAPTNQVAFENGTTFRVDTPFYGTHETYKEEAEDQAYCNLSHLCLGVAEVGMSDLDAALINPQYNPTRCKILCILRSRSRYDHDDCRHLVDLSRMAHVSAENCKAVARLWGWREIVGSLTGAETVSISKLGTRIAVAMWNKIYIWTVDPKMLCEDVEDIDTEDEEDEKKKARKRRRREKVRVRGVADDFYERVKDKTLGWKIAIIKPVVLDLNGAVAHKMNWTIKEEEDDHEDEVEGSDHEEEEEVREETIDTEEAAALVVADVLSSEEHDSSSIEPQSAIATPKSDESLTENTPDGKLMRSDTASHPQSDDNLHRVTKSVADQNKPPSSSEQHRVRQVVLDERHVEDDNSAPNITVVESQNLDLDQSAAPQPLTLEKKGKQREVDPEVSSSVISSSTTTTVPNTASAPASNQTANHQQVCSKPSSSLSQSQPVDELPVATSSSPSSSSNSNRVASPSKHKIRHKKRITEDELVVLTDRGVQVWDLGCWGRGRRVVKAMGERL